MLKVIFGPDLDGYETPFPQSKCGEVILGPFGLLNFLEIRLGLRGICEGEPVRTTQYLRCLRLADNGCRFYSKSLSVDELAVARELLGWRDTWIEAGWQGTAREGDSAKLIDMAAVEAHARDYLALGSADRLRNVLGALQDNRLDDIVVEVVGGREDLISTWREIFNLLSAFDHLPAPFRSNPTAIPDSDLALLQQAVLDHQQVCLQGDGTVVFLTATDETLLARAVSQILHGTVNLDQSAWFKESLTTTVIDGGNAAALDMIFEGDGQPLTGSSTPSRWRPPLQVLPLSLSLLWSPLDPFRLLEFLTHPVGPLPRRVRSRLAQIVAEYPGIGGEHWQQAIVELVEKDKERAGGDNKAGETSALRIEQWLFAERFDPDEGAPVQRVAEQCGRVCRWAAGQAEREGLIPSLRALYHAASAQASQAQRTLDDLAKAGQERIARLQLDRLIDQVTSLGSPVTSRSAELGHIHLSHSPGALIESRQRILWWNFSEPALPCKWPWSTAELGQLAANGAHLSSVDSSLQRLADFSTQPILAASRQLIFALPAKSCGEVPRPHPLWDRIAALTGKTVPTVDVGSLLKGSVRHKGLALTLSPMERHQLPQPVRWWQIRQPQLLPRRAKESFSSLQCFIESPYQWVLRYQASLNAGSLTRIENGNRQKGNLFHRLFKMFFSAKDFDWRQADRGSVVRWVSIRFDTLLAEEGANFLLPGRLREKQELIETAQRSAWSLVEFLRAAKVRTVEVEKPVDGSFTGGDLSGFIDLLVTNEEGVEAVVDLKWSGAQYRRQELRENRMLQLAVYAYLRKRQGRWPAQAFYMLSECRLLAQDAGFFPNAEVCSPGDENDHIAALWLAFEKTWKWRRQQFDQGLIEVTVTGTAADGNPIPPEGRLPIGEHNDRFNEFGTLTGWQEGA